MNQVRFLVAVALGRSRPMVRYQYGMHVDSDLLVRQRIICQPTYVYRKLTAIREWWQEF